jgi:hypothetical protein
VRQRHPATTPAAGFLTCSAAAPEDSTRLTRRYWLATAVAAVILLLGAATFAGSAHHASGQGEPHGTLPTNQIPVQVRPFHGAPAELTPEAQRHGHAAPGEQGEDRGHGHGNGHGQDDPGPQSTPESGDGQ